MLVEVPPHSGPALPFRGGGTKLCAMPEPSRRDVLVSDRDGVRTLTLNRPESLNGLTVEMVSELDALFHAAADAPEVRVVVVTGAGGAFCSGLDLKAATESDHLAHPEEGLAIFQGLVRTVRHTYKPTLAALDGAAAGFGADLALACDLRLASPRARLGERFVRLGLVPDGGGTFFLPRLVGLGKAFELIYEGRMVEAEEAEGLGLVNRVLPEEGFADAVQAYAARLAKGPPLAYARAKRAILAGLGPHLEASLGAEAEGQLALLRSEDFREGVTAFLEKREPGFEGR